MPFLLKDWKEMYRSNILISSFGLIVFICLLIISQVYSYNSETTFSQIFIPLFQSNIYFIPLVSMIIASFTIQQERLQKTMPILFTSYLSKSKFLWLKSISTHLIVGTVLIMSYSFVFLICKLFISVSLMPFIYFLLSILFLSMIFNQIGSYLGCVTENRIQLLSYILIIWFMILFIYDLILIYFVPNLESKDVNIFSIFYFLSPINTARYFLYVGLNVYDLDSFGVLFDHFAFKSPILILTMNLIFYLSVFYGLGIFVIKKRGFKE